MYIIYLSRWNLQTTRVWFSNFILRITGSSVGSEQQHILDYSNLSSHWVIALIRHQLNESLSTILLFIILKSTGTARVAGWTLTAPFDPSRGGRPSLGFLLQIGDLQTPREYAQHLLGATCQEPRVSSCQGEAPIFSTFHMTCISTIASCVFAKQGSRRQEHISSVGRRRWIIYFFRSRQEMFVCAIKCDTCYDITLNQQQQLWFSCEKLARLQICSLLYMWATCS